jgi:hypothetical protein
MDVVSKIENLGSQTGRPRAKVVIEDCGELKPETQKTSELKSEPAKPAELKPEPAKPGVAQPSVKTSA